MSAMQLGRGKWVFADWEGVNPGYGTAWGGAVGDGFCVPEGIELTIHRPHLDLTPVIERDADKPWEAYGLGFANFIADDGRFRCWYTTMYPNDHPKWKVGVRLACAESDDGVTWRKPVLNLRDFGGSTANNLTLVTGKTPSQYGFVFKDPAAPAEARYKMVAPGGKLGVLGSWSSDGLNFTSCDEPILPGNATDTDNACWRHPATGRYAVYTRQPFNSVTGRRAIHRAESDDFAHFPPSTPVIDIDPNDPPDWDYYANAFQPWPGAPEAQLMRVSVFKRTSDRVEVHLATSRDERRWHRRLGQEPWVTLDDEHPARFQQVYACNGILPTARGEWSLYFTLWKVGHNEVDLHLGSAAPFIVRGTIREDGFTSLSAEGHGQFWTMPFACESSELRVNARTRHSGYLKCELLASKSPGLVGASIPLVEPIPGYGLAESDPICGDHLDAALTWRGSSDLSAFRGRDLVLHFALYKADLYAVRFLE